jgi:transposase
MQVKTILNPCHKFKSFGYDQVRFVVEQGERFIEVTVVPRRNSQAICSCCGERAPLYDRLEGRRFEFIPLWGYRVFLHYVMRRVQCAPCGVKVEQVPWTSGHRELTDTYQHFLAHWAKKLSWKEGAISFPTSWEQVFQAVETVVQWGWAHRALSGITARGGGRDRLAQRAPLPDDGLPDRCGEHAAVMGRQRANRQDAVAFLSVLREGTQPGAPMRLLRQVEALSQGHPEEGGQAVPILDRDPLVAKLNEAIDRVRASEHRQMQHDGYEPLLKKSRGCLLKRRENLTEQQEAKLKDLLQYHLKSVRADLLKEDFTGFWE